MELAYTDEQEAMRAKLRQYYADLLDPATVAELAAAIVAESLLWPAERRLQADVAAGVDPGSPNRSVELHVLLCIRTAAMGIGILVALVAATVLMVAKPGG